MAIDMFKKTEMKLKNELNNSVNQLEQVLCIYNNGKLRNIMELVDSCTKCMENYQKLGDFYSSYNNEIKADETYYASNQYYFIISDIIFENYSDKDVEEELNKIFPNSSSNNNVVNFKKR